MSLDLKESVDVASLMEVGMLFHRLGAMTAKARPPLGLRFDPRTLRSLYTADLRDLMLE